MNDFEIALNPKDVALNARNFVKAHKSELRQMMSAIYPYLFVFTALSLYCTYIMQISGIDEQLKLLASKRNPAELLAYIQNHHMKMVSHPVYYFSLLMRIVIAYCFAMLAIGWHRLVLLGSNNYESMSFLYPKKSELEFAFLWTVMGTLVPLIPVFMMTLAGYIFVAVCLTFLFLPYLSFKICFYFPAKALNSEVTLSESFKLTKGYFWKFCFASIRAMWRISLLLLLCSFVVGILGAILSRIVFPTDNEFMRGVYSNFFTIPIISITMIFIFQPLLTVLGVTVLSNYYQHAMQHKAEFYKQS